MPQTADEGVREALALWQAGRRGEAQSLCEALVAATQHADALSLLAEIYNATGQATDEIATLRRLTRERPRDAGFLRRLGNALLAQGACSDAVTTYHAALALEPGNLRALNNQGRALMQLGRLPEAIASFEQAIELEPRYALAYLNLGIALSVRDDHERAIAHFQRAHELQPSLLDALVGLGDSLQRLKRYEEAVQVFTRLLAADPGYKYGLGSVLGARLGCCDWTGYEKSCAQIEAAVQAGDIVVRPFLFLAISDSPEQQLRCAQAYVADQISPAQRKSWSGAKYTHDKIRVAYLSADFHDHATAALMAGLFEAHDRRRFETIAISYGPDDRGAMRRRLVQAFDRFEDVRQVSDADAVQLMRTLEVDIAVDLKGHTTRRTGLIAGRPAPILVNYLGYPGASGLDEVDYILADSVILPPEHQAHYSEAVVYLPGCYQVNDDQRPIAAHTPERAELGLPEHAFVFCCFNNHYKITPSMFDIWMQLLRQIPGSVLWLLEDNVAAARNLRLEAQRRGIGGDRLVFAPRAPPEVHLARHRRADLFLDTLPYNAHTTASDALWAGLPVLTCQGSAFAGRVAASLLRAIGLPGLITHNLEEYLDRALQLATDPQQLAELRALLARNRTTEPLFYTGLFCRHLETAYTTMWERYQAGLPPLGFAIAPTSGAHRPKSG